LPDPPPCSQSSPSRQLKQSTYRRKLSWLDENAIDRTYLEFQSQITIDFVLRQAHKLRYTSLIQASTHVFNLEKSKMSSNHSIVSSADEGNELGLQPKAQVNVGDSERLLSGLIGASLFAKGLLRGSFPMIALGTGLGYRAVTGHCHVYEKLGIDSTADSDGSENQAVLHKGIKIEESLTIGCPAEKLFRLWKNFETFPQFMKNIRSVERVGDNETRWIINGPFGKTIEWLAEIFNERPNEMLAWRSLEGSQVDIAGSIQFQPSQEPDSTDVHISLQYDPPAGKLGALLASIFGKRPTELVVQDLRRFKEYAESQHEACEL
jgi:uncharacterized membrane protein